MRLSRQGSTEAADPSSALFQPPLISQHPQQASFIMASAGQPLPTSNYSISSHAPPTQQVLPPQGYMQPPQQIQVSYYSPGQYPNSNQQYRPLSHPVAYSHQRGQQLPQASQQPGKEGRCCKTAVPKESRPGRSASFPSGELKGRQGVGTINSL